MARKARSRKASYRDDDYDEEDDFDETDYDEEDEEGDDTPGSISVAQGKSLKTLLAPNKLRGYGWNRSFERGEKYYRAGAVLSLIQHGERLSATVQGSRKYKAGIWRDGGRLRYSCTCLAGGFCKHLVAAALAWNAGKVEVLGDLDTITAPGGELQKSRGKSKKIDIRAHLLTLDKEKLIDIILEQAVGDTGLRERLQLSAAVANPDGVDLESFRQRIDAALEPPEVDYDDRYWDEEDPYEGYADQLKPILDALESLLEKGQAASVATLAEYALAGLSEQCLEMEYGFADSDAMVEPLVSLHVRACSITKPDQAKLAEWLYRLGIRDAAGEFGGLPWEKYKPLLGKTGLAHFWRLAEADWQKIPSRTARTGDDPQYLLRRKLQDVMMRFAEEDGDVDAQAAVVKKDLSSQTGYVELVKIYKSAKRYDEALSWAEKGWAAFPNQYGHSAELRDLLAGEYRRKNHIADAMALYWNEFSESPGLSKYEELKKQADKNKNWPSWREKAFALMRERIAAERSKKEKNAKKSGWSGENPYQPDGVTSGDNSLLVQILLWEKKFEEAWSEAQAGGCQEQWWLKLSSWREKSHPGDCVPIWLRRMERLTKYANPQDYTPAAESLVKLGELMKRIGMDDRFDELVKQLREELKRRRNFIKELDKRKLL